MMNSTMTDRPSRIEKTVMRRVRMISFARPLCSSEAFAALLLVAALWAIGREVWVAKVFSNGPHDFAGHAEYLVYAFEHTRLVVQALVLVTLGATVYLAQATARVLTAHFVPGGQRI